MDRWIDADDDIKARQRAKPQGKVATTGLEAFVRGAVVENPGFGKIEVVSSKKEQVKRAQDAAAMPPPPPMPPFRPPQPQQPAPPPPSSHERPPFQERPPFHEASASDPSMQPSTSASGPANPPPSGQHGFKPPSWVSRPPAGAVMEVYKGDELVQELPLELVATVFGRHISADVVCEHPSLSRLHAAVCFQGMTGKCLVLDLGSTHGTFVDGAKVDQAVPKELKPGGEVRFGASTRRYVYKVQRADLAPHKRQMEHQPPLGQQQDGAKRGRMFLPDGT